MKDLVKESVKNVLEIRRHLTICVKSETFGNFNPLSANPTKWSNTLKQFVGKLPTNCLSVIYHFKILALKWLTSQSAQIKGFP